MTLRLETHYRSALESAERHARLLMSRQERGGTDRGGFRNADDGLVHPGAVTGSLLTLIPVLVNPDSSLAGSPALVDSTLLALECSRRLQRPDGTFDLLTSNFFSSPDNGFIMHTLARCYRLLEAAKGAGAVYPGISEALYELIVSTGRGMVGAGFHTPNHRWVVAAALVMAYRITGSVELIDEANRYLAEGIDIDSDGEYTERSSGIYNAVNDNAFMILADELDRNGFLDPVEKNLEMMFAYFEPDGSIFTWNSTRQDKGEGGVGGTFQPTTYYPIYLGMLTRRFDPRYAWVVDSIYRNTVAHGGPGSLYRFMLDPALRHGEYEIEPPVTDFDRLFSGSAIARIRRGAVTATVLAHSSSFLFVQAGSIRCRVKLCASFFSVAQFRGESLEYVDGEYRMRFATGADYRLPLDPPPTTPMWREMDHGRRVHVKEQTLVFEVSIRVDGSRTELAVKSTGCDRVPLKLEFIFSPGTTVTGDSFALPGKPGGSITVKQGAVTASTGSDRITVGPAFGDHHFTESMRGSEPQSTGEFTLYFTATTPIDRKVIIEAASV